MLTSPRVSMRTLVLAALWVPVYGSRLVFDAYAPGSAHRCNGCCARRGVPSENAATSGTQPTGAASENTDPYGAAPRRGRAPVPLPPVGGPSRPATSRAAGRGAAVGGDPTHLRLQIRGYLAWLATADVEGEPLAEALPETGHVREYRTHPAAVLKRSNATINNALAAVDDFYTRTGLGPAAVQRLDLAPLAPRALIGRAVTRWLRAAGTVESARDRALILTPFYAGARNGETVTLDLDDVRLSTRKGNVRFYGKGAKPRQVELHPQLREAYTARLDERTGWPGAGATTAFFLNRRGGRLSARQDRLAGVLTEIRPHLNERQWRLLLGAQARAVGRGGIKLVAQVVGASVAAARVLCRCAEVGPGACPTPERRPVLARPHRPGPTTPLPARCRTRGTLPSAAGRRAVNQE